MSGNGSAAAVIALRPWSDTNEDGGGASPGSRGCVVVVRGDYFSSNGEEVRGTFIHSRKTDMFIGFFLRKRLDLTAGSNRE